MGRRFRELDRAERITFLAMGVAAGVIALALYCFDPAASGFFPACPLHAVTGWHCPGCGSSRAVHLLLHGDVAGAFRMNALLFPAVPFVIGLVVWPRLTKARYTPVVALVVIVAYGVLRNIPLWPLSLLAPH